MFSSPEGATLSPLRGCWNLGLTGTRGLRRLAIVFRPSGAGDVLGHSISPPYGYGTAQDQIDKTPARRGRLHFVQLPFRLPPFPLRLPP